MMHLRNSEIGYFCTYIHFNRQRKRLCFWFDRFRHIESMVEVYDIVVGASLKKKRKKEERERVEIEEIGATNCARVSDDPPHVSCSPHASLAMSRRDRWSRSAARLHLHLHHRRRQVAPKERITRLLFSHVLFSYRVYHAPSSLLSDFLRFSR